MAFIPSIVLEVQRVSPRCFICNHKFARKEYRPVHSGSGFHLRLREVSNPIRYVYEVMDPPGIYRYMKGKLLEIGEFSFGFRYFADAVCVCNGCHRDIHTLALELNRQRIPDFSGSTPLPRLLVEATFSYHLHRSPILA